MSHVTNVLLLFDGLEDEFAAAFASRTIAELSNGQALEDITTADLAPAWGGHKAPEWDAWGAALNYVRHEIVMLAVELAPWRSPECVRLLIQGQNSKAAGVWVIRNGRLVRAVEELHE